MAGRVSFTRAISTAQQSDLLHASSSSSYYISRARAGTGNIGEFVREARVGGAGTRNAGSPGFAIDARTAADAKTDSNPMINEQAIRPKPKKMSSTPLHSSAGLVLQNSERSDPEPSIETQLHGGEAVYWFR